MYQEGDILLGFKQNYIVLGITEDSSLNNVNYMLYPYTDDIFEKTLNPLVLYKISFQDIKVVGRKNKKDLELWIMKNRMLNDLPFVSVKQYMTNRHK